MLRRALVLCIGITLLPSFSAAEILQIRPSTTLSRETGNNTSTARNFVTQANGNQGATNISKLDIHSLLYPASQTKIFAHLMLWFGQPEHMNVGYNSADPAQVKRQIDGVVMVWYGRNNAINQAAKLVMHEAELHPGFSFAIMVDNGAIRWNSCPDCGPKNALVQDLQYLEQTFFLSPAYFRVEGRPAVATFDIDKYYEIRWSVVRSELATDPLFMFQNETGFDHGQSDGAFSWSIPTTPDFGMQYLTDFYTSGLNSPGKQTWGVAYKGFNDKLAAWGMNRRMGQQCGQTWLQTFSKINSFYNSTNQLAAMQLVTWNDYEEGTEIESGIDNCVNISASLAGSSLQWKITARENTVDHYRVYISKDGQNLMPLADLPRGSRALDACSYSLAPRNYTFFVQAVGKPSIKNQISGPVDYVPNCSPPQASVVVGSAVRFTAHANSGDCSKGVASMGIYVNDTLKYVVRGSDLNTKLQLKPGNYKTTVQQWDYCGGSSFTIVPVTVPK
jgi:hypothetical protein